MGVVATEVTLVTVVENRLLDVSDGRGMAEGTTDSEGARSGTTEIPLTSDPSSLPSLAAAGAVGDEPTALTLFNREGIKSVGFDSAVSVPKLRCDTGCCTVVVEESSSANSTARENGFPNVAGFRML